jgi:hypothetical protein
VVAWADQCSWDCSGEMERSDRGVELTVAHRMLRVRFGGAGGPSGPSSRRHSSEGLTADVMGNGGVREEKENRRWKDRADIRRIRG